MNKKFSTFLIAALAFSGVGSVFGQGDLQPSPMNPASGNFGKHAERGAYLIQKLDKGANAGLFQIAIEGNADKVLGLNEDDQLIVVDLTRSLASQNVPSFSYTLWCVTTSQENQSQAPKFDYLNKGAGLPLEIAVVGDLASLDPHTHSNPANLIEVGGNVGGWSLSAELGDINGGDGLMYSTFKTDSVIGFYVAPGTTDLSVLKAGHNEVRTSGYYTPFQLQAAKTIRLKANDINTILNTQDDDKGVQLAFNRTVDPNRENPFADAPFFAEEVTVGDAEYVRIRKDDNTYLRVDTSYANTSGYAFLDYKWQTITNAMITTAGAADAADYIDGNSLRDQYSFLFTYSPTYDSLYIQVERVQLDDTFDATWTADRTVRNPYINIQNVDNNAGIMTVEGVQNVHVTLGFTGCVPSDDKTSVPQDLYVITNSKGQYLAVPIYGDSVAYWVTLDKEVEHVEPWNMPSFQWVVEKTQNATEALRPTSPIKITNREFPAVNYPSVQLYNNDYALIYALEKKTGDRVAGSINVASFEAASATVKADPYVGYRKLDKDSLLITGYTLRYLHDYNDQNYIGKAHGDSVLYAAGEKVRFAVDTIETRNASGVLVSSEVNYGYRGLSSLAQLKRQAYQLRVKGEVEDTYVVANNVDRYAVSASDDATVVARRSVFFLKENNYKDGISYYALIDTAAFRNSAPDSLRKMGVADASVLLKAEDMTELRTSAFALEYDETPLYRRFKTDPAENATASTNDGPEVMRFKEIYRNEYLQIESNPNFTVAGIDFLGIDALNKYEGGKSFTVDSAWVGRGLGYIKPQYLISIDRNDQAPVEAIPCPEEFHGYAPDGTAYDQWTCPHAIAGSAGFNRGKYLINFEFIGYGDGDANEYMWRKYYRAGFVDGVQVGDSLYILRDEFAGLTNAQINLDNIIAADSAWRKADKDEDRTNKSYYIVNLRGDQHKYVTWSMRYVDPENYEQDNTFLIESMNRSHNVNQDQWIAPTHGAWLKMQNGCLVLSTYDSSFDIETGGDDALVFNVEYIEGDELATDDEVIAENSVVVIAGQGNVTVKNAAGKKVAISNILGQTVANTVVTSDNATIAVPAGVVVVAVEGEAAVKAIVK